MRKKFVWRGLVVLGLAALGMAACDKDIVSVVNNNHRGPGGTTGGTTVVVITAGGSTTLRSGAGCVAGSVVLSANVPVTWSSPNPAVATVNSNGTVTAVSGASGSVTITATPTAGGTAGMIVINVDNSPCTTTPTLGSIEIQPRSGTVQVGQTIGFTVVCKNTNGNVMTCPTLQWITQNAPTAVVSQSGVVTGISPGTTQICVRYEQLIMTVQDCVNVTVTAGPGNPTIYITPINPTITLGLVNGVCQATLQFTAHGQNGSAVTATWSATGGSFNNSGLYTATTAGTYTVTASSGGATAQTQVIVVGNCQTNNQWTIMPANDSIQCNTTQQFQFTRNGVPTTGTWTISGGGNMTSGGFFTPSTAGTYTVTVTVNGTPYTTQFTVLGPCGTTNNATVRVLPDSLVLTIGGFGTFTATVTNGTANGTWSSDCVQLGTASNQGTNSSSVVVNATRVCRGYVRYMLANGQFDDAIVIVTSGATGCTWSTASGSYSLVVGQTVQGNATCTYQGQPHQPYWYSTDPGRFTVVGAPFVVVIGGVSYPAGPTATIKAIWAGTADICVQAAVQDPTVKFCRTMTATAASSSMANASMSEYVLAENEMFLPAPPPAGAKIDKIMTFAEWKASQK